MESKHIRREFNANVQNRQHYTKKKWLLEIHKQRMDTVETYLADDVEVKNAKITNWRAWDSCNPNSSKSTISFTYDAPEDGDYRIDCLYSTIANTEKLMLSLNNTIKIDGKVVKNDHDWLVYPQYHSRNCKTVHLTKGKHTITYEFLNTIFLGAILRKVETYRGGNYNNEYLTMHTFNNKQSNDLSVNTFSCTMQYWHGLDDETNISGYLFDFDDEVNFSIETNNGKMKQIFGGYVSTISVDKDLKLMTINCGDRLRDLDIRYCYPEYVLLGGTEDMPQYRLGNSYYDLENYSEVLQHLLTHAEITLNSNLKDMGSLKSTVYARNPYLKFYGNNKNKVLVKNNVEVKEFDNCIQLRNSTKTKTTQAVKLFDSKGKAYDLSKTPTFFIQYGMGEEKYEAKSEEQSTVEEIKVGTSTISSDVRLQAKKITSGNGMNAVKDLHRWVSAHITHEWVKGFYQKPSTTLKRGKGNCGCKAWLLMDLCDALGVFNNGIVGYYVHEHNNSNGKGHYYCLFKYQSNGKTVTKIVDPSTKQYGVKADFCKRYNLKEVKRTKYPTRP